MAPAVTGARWGELFEGQSIGQQIALAPGVEHVNVAGGEPGIGAAGTEGGYRREDQSGVDFGQRFPLQPPRRGQVGGRVVDDNVGPGSQLPQHPAALRVIHVQRNPALPGVQVEEQPAAFRVGRIAGERPASPRRVTRLGRLDFHHVGSQRGQQLAAVGRRRHSAQLQHPQTGEGGGGVTFRQWSCH